MSKRNERKSGVVLSYVSIVLNTIIQLLYTPLLIRMLSQSEYGLFSLVSSIIGYLTIMDLGFGNAIVVYTAKYRAQGNIKDEQKLHGMFNVVFKVIGLVAGIIGIILLLNVESIFGQSMTNSEIGKMKIMMIILSFNLFLSFYFAIYNSIITAYEKFTFQKIITIIHSLLKPMLMIPLLFLGFKSISLCIIITLANVFTLLSNYFYCKKKLNICTKYCGFDKKIFKMIISYSIWIFLGIIVDKINWSVDNFILGVVSGTIAVSVYSVASTINQMIVSLSTSISGVLLPKMSKLVENKASSNVLTNEMIKVGRLQYYIIFLFCSGFVFFGKYFIYLWVGDQFSTSYYITLLLIIPASFSLIQNVGLSILQAMNKYRFKTIMNFFISICNILISIILASKYGAIGAAIGTAISLVIGNAIVMNIYYYKVIKLDIIKFWISIIKMTIFFLIPVFSFIFFNLFIQINNLLNFTIFVLLYTIMFSLVSYTFVMNDYEKSIINNIFCKIRGGKK